MPFSGAKLKNNRFAAIVISDVRGPDGIYMKLPQKTIEIMERNNCFLYNKGVVLSELATAAMKAFNFMNTFRKLARAHQFLYVFLKGSSSEATERLPKFLDNV